MADPRVLVGLVALATAFRPDVGAGIDPIDDRSVDRGNAGVAAVSIRRATAIEIVDPSVIACDMLVDFENVVADTGAGTNYDSVLSLSGAAFGERFVGQCVSTMNTYFDTLGGSPVAPLQVQAGTAGENLACLDYAQGSVTSNILAGVGPFRFPNYDAIGEGAIAALFDYDQVGMSFSLLGGGPTFGYATVSFFRRDGSLIDVLSLAAADFDTTATYGFRRVSGARDIAGFTIENDDGGGIGFDDLCLSSRPVTLRSTTWGSVKSRYR